MKAPIRPIAIISIVLISILSQKTLSQSLENSSNEDIRSIEALINTLRSPNVYNWSMVAMVNESVEVDRAGFNKKVFGGSLGDTITRNTQAFQTRSNIFAYMLSGSQWKMVREASDRCIHLLDITFHSTTNLSDLSPTELGRLKEIYCERLAFDPTSRYGYQWAAFGPFQSSVLTSEESSPPGPFYLNLASSIEREIAFTILLALGQTNVASKKLCHPLFYDFSEVEIDLKTAKGALDSKRVALARNSTGPGVEFILKTPFNVSLRFQYEEHSRIPFALIEITEDGIITRRITRNIVKDKPWSLEWFDEQFNAKKDRTSFSKRYILSESVVNVEDLFAAFDATQKKSDVRSHQKRDGSYQGVKNGREYQRSATSVDTIEFWSNYGRWASLLGFSAVSFGFGWMLFRRR